MLAVLNTLWCEVLVGVSGLCIELLSHYVLRKCLLQWEYGCLLGCRCEMLVREQTHHRVNISRLMADVPVFVVSTFMSSSTSHCQPPANKVKVLL